MTDERYAELHWKLERMSNALMMELFEQRVRDACQARLVFRNEEDAAYYENEAEWLRRGVLERMEK